jgi:cytochrome c oxidase assembly protein subunit 15
MPPSAAVDNSVEVERPGYSPWPRRIGLLLAAAILLMILAGGTVTTLGVGDSDPAWSLSFWKWFRPWSEMPGGQIYEITHRQIGTVIGFLAFIFIAVLLLSDRRHWIRYLGLLIFTGVVLQGLLGGLRVLVVSNPDMQQRITAITGLGTADNVRNATAIIHAGLAQLVFGLVVVVSVATSRSWTSAISTTDNPLARRIRQMGLITTAVVFFEMLIGAYVRHAGRWIPAHVVGALVVSLFAVILAINVLSGGLAFLPLRRTAVFLAILVQVQVFLGIASLLYSPLARVAPTLHVMGGAGILAAVIVLTVRSFKTPARKVG